MAWLVGDSFDFYATGNDMFTGSAPLWTLGGSAPTFTTGRFPGSQCINSIGSGSAFSRTTGSNDQTIYVNFAMFAVALSGTHLGGVLLIDGSTVQCSVYMSGTGSLDFYRGTPSGTLLGSYTGAFIASNWTQFQIKFIISSSVGEIHVRKNGNTVDDFALTGLNTQSSGNAYANVIKVDNSFSGGSGSYHIDDLYCFSGTGASPNTWQGDVRAVQQMAASDPVTLLFSKSPAQQILGIQSTTSTIAKSANTIYFQSVTPTYDSTVSKITVNLSSGFTGHLAAAVYATDSGSDALLATATALTNPGSGTQDLVFSSPPSVSGGSAFGIAIWADAAFTLVGNTNAANRTQALTYTGTFPNPSTTIAAVSAGSYWATVVPRSYDLINEATEDGLTTYIFDPNVGDEDDFGIAPLTTTPTAIVCVQAKMWCQKSDAGSRSGDLYLKSGSGSDNFGSTVLSSTGGFLTLPAPVDPNTSASWNQTGVNALTVGPKVTA
ncbi:MAG TPA: hypothetical protein VGR45_17305 [Stellaceae bacterium]|nr:hypothetical protein [Stellaceae bacterium]